MKKNLGNISAVYPMPVLMIAAYDENGNVNVMNAAWGIMCDYDKVALNVDEDHKTMQNILKTKAFTVALADFKHMAEADYFGMVSGNDVPDKFEKTGMTAVKSEFVNAPVINEFPVAMECELYDVVEKEKMYCMVGKIVNVTADEELVGADGKVDISKADILAFDTFKGNYYRLGELAGKAWSEGEKVGK
ncbi:MAG: flavin reductase family protein [Clostridia bacterium]|nr:flavin reductase family protein [Clostridia bacterium]